MNTSRRLQLRRRTKNYIEIRFNVTSTTTTTQIIGDSFVGGHQIDYICFNNWDNGTHYDYSKTFQFTWGGERIGFIHFKDNPTNLEYLFSGITNITYIDMNNLNTKYVTSMALLCAGCTSLVQIFMSKCRADNLVSLCNTFNSCSVLKYVDFGSYISGQFKPKKLIDIRNMFNWCRQITSINMSMFDLSSVDMFGYTWGNCYALKEIYISSTFKSSASMSTTMFVNSTTSNAKIYYNNNYDVSRLTSVIGSNWSLVPYNY